MLTRDAHLSSHLVSSQLEILYTLLVEANTFPKVVIFRTTCKVSTSHIPKCFYFLSDRRNIFKILGYLHSIRRKNKNHIRAWCKEKSLMNRASLFPFHRPSM